MDGLTIASLCGELNAALSTGTIQKVIQPEAETVVLSIRAKGRNHLLTLTASPSLPLAYLTDKTEKAPLTAPNFCMLLRKHLGGARIEGIEQIGLERVILIRLEQRDEFGDPAKKKLILELMGKHSNLILTDANDTIIDSIKRIPSSVSSVREVLPGRTWFLPNTANKEDLTVSGAEAVRSRLSRCPVPVSEAVNKCYAGISRFSSEDLCAKACVEPAIPFDALSKEDQDRFLDALLARVRFVKTGSSGIRIVYDENGMPLEFSPDEISLYPGHEQRFFESPSMAIRTYYSEREAELRQKEHTASLRQVIRLALDRVNKKATLQEKRWADTEKRDLYRKYGDLLQTYGATIPAGADKAELPDYETGETVEIRLDPNKSAQENAQICYARYSKLKRTREALKDQLERTYADREQLEGCAASLDLVSSEADIAAIKRELVEYGFLKQKEKHSKKKGREERSLPYRYRTKDGFLLLVGRNNLQNEEVSFRWANGNDWWFHVKEAPGSHVVIKGEGVDVPDHVLVEAASCAAYYSSCRRSEKVEVDYTRRKELHKKKGGKPGFVTYHNYYSMVVSPTLSGLTPVKD